MTGRRVETFSIGAGDLGALVFGAALLIATSATAQEPGQALSATAAGAAPGGAAPPAPAMAAAAAPGQTLLERAGEAGGVPVIVELSVPTMPDAELSGAAATRQRSAIAAIQQRVLSRLGAVQPPAALEAGAAAVANVKTYDTVPLMALTANRASLQQLLDDPDVIRVHEDIPVPPTLATSVPLIGGDVTASEGHTGAGQTVAIIDTGVDKSHPFFGGRVVSEACYSTSNSVATSFCPGGASASTASGSGVPCPSGTDGCDHGTHVAGIAAGSGSSFTGVAPAASIVAIQAFSEFTGTNCTDFELDDPCALTYTSDQIEALERVYELRNTHTIAAVNMSLGGGSNSAHCDTDPRKTIVDNLHAAGIATAIASGNDGLTGSIGAPACISTAVAVGSTTKQDAVSGFSNHAEIVDLMAPGSAINASVPGGGTGVKNGTSMATPHVTGAFAVLRHASPGSSVDEIVTALASTGAAVSRAGISKPRIQLDDTVDALVGAPPGPTSLIAPSGTIQTALPTYSWSAVPAAAWYRLYVNDSAASPRISQWYSAAAAGCADGAADCAVTPGTSLAVGGATWWVRTWNPNGNGPWSSPLSFAVDAGGFDEQFDTVSGNWTAHSGGWSVVLNDYYHTTGAAGQNASASYDDDFADFDYRARLFRTGCNTCATELWVRASGFGGNGVPQNGYRFNYNRNGQVAVFKYVNGSASVLQPWTASAAINQGNAWNELRVVANDDSLSYFINGALVWSGTDGAHADGRAGIGMYKSSAGQADALDVDYAVLDVSEATGPVAAMAEVAPAAGPASALSSARASGSPDEAPQ